jgi:hypothetical protein
VGPYSIEINFSPALRSYFTHKGNYFETRSKLILYCVRYSVEEAVSAPAAKRQKLSESLEERKNKLLSNLQQKVTNDIQESVAPVSLVPSVSPDPRVPSSSSSRIYSDLLTHFEKNPEELREFSSRVVLDALRFMRDRTAPVESIQVTPAASQTAPIPIIVNERSNAMDVDLPPNENKSAAPAADDGPIPLQLLQKATQEYSGDVNKFLKGVKWYDSHF